MHNNAMPDYQPLIQWMQANPQLQNWATQLPSQIERGLAIERWGDLPAWQTVLDNLPALTPSSLNLSDGVHIGESSDCSDEVRDQLRQNLMGLHPWRKGPWELFGLAIDTEWRSDWKWDRLKPHLGNLDGQTVLDVGCGNGYHCLRLHGAGAQRVIGIDPSAKFVYQFEAFKRYLPHTPVDVLPLGIEHMPANLNAFDTVLSMGVIYHRRDPLAHIQELMGCLKPGGQLVLETLVVEDDTSLVPQGRYAKMRNVWCVPCPAQVLHWLDELELKNPRMVDLCPTTTEEQRATEWMHFESLANFLDPEDPTRTVEGYPAPKRAIFIANT